MNKKPLKVAILGFSREGQSVLKFLKKSKQYKGAEITILDKNTEVKVPRGVKAVLGPEYLRNLERFKVVFRSPGIPYMLPEIQRAMRHHVVISSSTQLFFDDIRSAKRRPVIVGVTGTKGKGTTTHLIFECLKAAKIKTVMAGNMGKPMLDSLMLAKKAKVVLLELSSFQLQDLKCSPDVSVVLHVTPDHLDAHQSLIEYYTAKAKIASHQDHTGAVFYLPDNIPSSEIARQSLGKKTLVVPELFSGFKLADLKIPGKHNFSNAVMAASVAASLGCTSEQILRAVKSFKGLPYRLSLSRTMNIGGGAEVRFYNDSVGTNPETAAAAIKSFGEPAVLIAGGKDKRLDYGALRNALMRSSVFAVVLFGENREKILGQLHGITQRIETKTTLEAAITAATNLAKQKAKEEARSTLVLFSPASASFDMFKSMYERGEQFDAIVKKLKV
jgi:UDP-N-acetylmuramoylalanine--D-glutamate ligase